MLTFSILALSLCALQENVKPALVIDGSDSQIPRRDYALVRTPSEWQELWRRHLGLDQPVFKGKQAPPDVDLTKYMIVSIVQGPSTNSTGIKIVSVQDFPKAVLVRYDDRHVQTVGPTGGGVKGHAFAFIVLPKTTKPIAIEENVQNLIGEPPKWELRKVLGRRA